MTTEESGKRTMTDLRALAEAATPGPWHRTKLQAGVGAAAFGRAIVNADESGYPGAMLEGVRAEADAAYIAAVSPDVVLALLDERDALRLHLQRLAFVVDPDHLDLYTEEVQAAYRAALGSMP